MKVLVYAPSDALRWVTEELNGEQCDLISTSSIDEFLESASEFSRSTVMIVDVDWLAAPDIVELHGLREVAAVGTSSGPMIGLGDVPRELRASLRITHDIARPFGSERLRHVISGLPRLVA